MAVVHLKNGNKVQIVNDYAFDKEILCEICDGSFSHSENYASKFLTNALSGIIEPFKTVNDNAGNIDIYYSANIFLIKKCLLSILWRLSISSRKHFSEVRLGQREDMLKARLNDDSIMDPQFFPFTIFSLKNANNQKAKGFSPVVPRFEYNGIETYVMHLHEYLIFFYAGESIPENKGLSSVKSDAIISIGEAADRNLQLYLQKIYPGLPNNPRSI
jgi:hypothetical protein